MSQINVFECTKLIFNFSSDKPFVHLKLPGSYDRTEYVDPFPCYAHDFNRVENLIHSVAEKFPVAKELNLHILHYEGYGRFNGFCSVDWNYSKDEESTYTHFIVLNGKRTPLHPAMTRFVVAHEYGHAVGNHIGFTKKEMGESERNSAHENVYPDYQKLRPGPYTQDYGGLTWHSNPAEVFADDFRILIAGMETEHWPHPGFDRPEAVPGLMDWWLAAHEKYKFVPKAKTEDKNSL